MNLKNSKACYLFIFLLTFSNTFSISGEKLYRLNELVNMSNFIVQGKVISIHSYKSDNGMILSDIKIKVLKTFKGRLKINEELNFTFIGGTLGSRTTFVLENPHFKAQQESILFLNQLLNDAQIPNAFLITGMAQGKFDINYGQSFPQIVRDKFFSSELTISTGTENKILSNKQAILLSEFINQLESLINNH